MKSSTVVAFIVAGLVAGTTVTAIGFDVRILTLTSVLVLVFVAAAILRITTRGVRLWTAPWLMFIVFGLYVVAPLTFHSWIDTGATMLPLMAAASILVYSFGALLGSRFFRGTTSEESALARPWIDTWNTLEFKTILLLLTVGAFTIGGYFLIQIGPAVVTALSLVIQDPLSYNAALAQTRLGIRPGNGFFVIWIIYVLPLITMAVLGRGLSVGRKSTAVLGFGLILITLAAMTLLTFRGYILYYLLTLFVVLELVLRRRGLSHLISYGIVMVAVLLGLDQLRGLGFESSIVQRANTIGDQLQYVLNTYGQTKPFLMGSSYVQDAITLLPGGPRLGFNGTVYRDMGYSGLGTTTVTLVGETYANFGLLGVIVGFTIYGWLAGLLHALFLRSRHSLQSMLWYSTFAVYLSKASIAGIGENVFPALAVLLPILAVMGMASLHSGPRPEAGVQGRLAAAPG